MEANRGNQTKGSKMNELQIAMVRVFKACVKAQEAKHKGDVIALANLRTSILDCYVALDAIEGNGEAA
jgi:hypothetical protein